MARPNRGCEHDPNDLLCEIPEGHKRCLDCEAVMPIDEFPRHAKTRTGAGKRFPYCAECLAKRRIDQSYGAGASAWFERQFERQGRKCAFCSRTDPGDSGKGKWCLDHDHRKPKGAASWRYVLCHACNIMLGYVEGGYDALTAAQTMKDRGHIR